MKCSALTKHTNKIEAILYGHNTGNLLFKSLMINFYFCLFYRSGQAKKKNNRVDDQDCHVCSQCCVKVQCSIFCLVNQMTPWRIVQSLGNYGFYPVLLSCSRPVMDTLRVSELKITDLL